MFFFVFFIYYCIYLNSFFSCATETEYIILLLMFSVFMKAKQHIFQLHIFLFRDSYLNFNRKMNLRKRMKKELVRKRRGRREQRVSPGLRDLGLKVRLKTRR